MAKRLRITETTDVDMKKRYWDKYYRPQRQRVGPLTPGLEVVFGFVLLADGYAEDDLVAMETAIEGIAGVDTCELVVSGSVPTVDDIPVDSEVYATVEGRFVLRETRGEIVE